MFIFVFTDGICSLYVYQSKSSLLQKMKHIISLPTIQKVIPLIYIPFSFSLTYDITYQSSSPTSLAIFMWCSVCYLFQDLFIFRVYLTFVKAVTLILKHATLLRISNLPKVALTSADQDYKKQDIDNSLDKSIQQYLMAHASHLSEGEFADFIMGTEIGWFILLFVTSISYCLVSVISVLSHCHGHCIDDSVSWNSFWS